MCAVANLIMNYRYVQLAQHQSGDFQQICFLGAHILVRLLYNLLVHTCSYIHLLHYVSHHSEQLQELYVL